jgi:hypothetical protein
MTVRRAEPFEKLCNAKQPLDAGAVRPDPVKPAIGIFAKNLTSA